MGRSTISTPARRRALRVALAAATLGLGLVALLAVPAGAQTATVPTVATTVPASPVTTLPTAASTLVVPTTAGGVTTTTTTVAEQPPEPLIATQSKSSTPWLAIALIAVGVIILVVLLVLALRRRGGSRGVPAEARRGSTAGRGRSGARAAWRERAAAATAEAGACVRQIATGAAVTGPMVAQLVTSIRGYAEMAGDAPDDDSRHLVERARRALQGLGQQIDGDHQLRRVQPPADPERLAASAQSVVGTAGETDRVLRAVYRELNEPD